MSKVQLHCTCLYTLFHKKNSLLPFILSNIKEIVITALFALSDERHQIQTHYQKIPGQTLRKVSKIHSINKLSPRLSNHKYIYL